MNLFIATQRIRNRGPVAREGGRVQHDHIPTRHYFLVRTRHSLRLEPIKYVGRLKRALVGKTIELGVAFGGSQSLHALVEHINLRCPRTRGVQAKTAYEAKAVEDLGASRQLRDEPVIDLLIEIKAGLVARQQV